MTERFAKIISYIFHPLFGCTYAGIFLVLANPHLFAFSSRNDRILWIAMVFLLTCIFPIFWVFLMKQLELIDSLKLEDRKQRIIPYVATATFYLWAFMLFKPTAHPNIFSNSYMSHMLLGAALAVFIGFFVNIFSKISLHTMAAGSFMALLLLMLGLSDYDLKLLFMAVILLSGLIGTARLILNAHSQGEVMWGYAAGFTGQFVAFVVIPHYFS
ncbi:MAG: hypothetical protein U0T73_11940 [Chitinophagales bacterium]